MQPVQKLRLAPVVAVIVCMIALKIEAYHHSQAKSIEKGMSQFNQTEAPQIREWESMIGYKSLDQYVLDGIRSTFQERTKLNTSSIVVTRNNKRCFNELLDFERTDETSVALRNAIQLLEEWQVNGQRVLFAGDSLLMQYATLLQCAAVQIGATFTREFVTQYNWKANTTSTSYDVEENPSDAHIEGKLNQETQALLMRYNLVYPDGSEFSFDYLRYYKMVSKSYIDNDMSPLEKDKGFQLVAENFCHIVIKEQYDRVYMNDAHMGYYSPTQGKAFTLETGANMDAIEPCQSNIVLLDHPPQEFDSSRGHNGGNYHTEVDKIRSCSCDVDYTLNHAGLNNLQAQQMARERGVKYMTFYNEMKAYCMFHRSYNDDCTHYFLSPTVWSPMTNVLLEDFYYSRESDKQVASYDEPPSQSNSLQQRFREIENVKRAEMEDKFSENSGSLRAKNAKTPTFDGSEEDNEGDYVYDINEGLYKAKREASEHASDIASPDITPPDDVYASQLEDKQDIMALLLARQD